MSSEDAGGSRDNAGGSSVKKIGDFLSECQQDLADEKMFAIYPLKNCPHLELMGDVLAKEINVKDPCNECSSTAENWICLVCFTVHCARNINQHASIHSQHTGHPLTLSFTDLSVWCYGCDAYVDNPRLYDVKNSAYKNKFNCELPWTYEEPRVTMSL